MPTFETTLTLGSGLVLLFILVATAIFIARSKAAGVWRDEAEAYKQTSARWQATAEERGAAIKRLEGRIREIEHLADNRPVLDVLKEMIMQTTDRHSKMAQAQEATAKLVAEQFKLSQKIAESLEGHEKRAEQRSEKIIQAFDSLTRRLDSR